MFIKCVFITFEKYCFYVYFFQQFIQGLQTASTTMVMQMPTTAAPQRFVIRHKRDIDFTTAKIIQYMDSFRVSQTHISEKRFK